MYITILEFMNAITYIREVPEELREKEGEDIAEAIAKDLGIRLSDCQWMIMETLRINCMV